MDKSVKNILLVFLFVLIFYLLTLLSNLLIPLVLAFLLTAVFQPVMVYAKKLRIPTFLIAPLLIIISLLILFGISQIVIDTASNMFSQKDFLFSQLEKKMTGLLDWLNNVSVNLIGKGISFQNLMVMIKPDKLSSVAGGLLSSLGSFTSSFIMFAIYYIVMISSLTGYDNFIDYVGGGESNKYKESIRKIERSIVSYLGWKTLISLLTGTMTFLICLFFGIKFAFFWGFLAFLLNFIPTVGSIVAVMPPVLMGIIQFDSISPVFFLLLCLVALQMTLGNFVEPIIMGNRLRLNTLTVMFGLVFWGYLWGIAGMFLAVPLLVILKIILEMNPSTEIVARIMGVAEKKK